MIRIRTGATAVVAPTFPVVPILLAALVLVPVRTVSAQVPVEDGQFDVHEIVRGETLSGLAERYLGTWSAWPEIFEMNRIRIEDPHWIYPRQTIAIPVAPGERAPVAVTGVGVAVPNGQPDRQPATARPAATSADASEYLARRELIRYRTFETQGNPPVDEASRTVFYDALASGDGDPRVLIQPEDAVPALPAAVFRAAGWLLPNREDVDARGELRGFIGDEGGRLTVHPYDEVRIDLFDGAVPRVGDELLVYRPIRSIDAGDVVAPSGRVRVTQVMEGAVAARVVQEYDRMRLGHRVTALRTFPLAAGVHPSESDVRLDARLLGFQDSKQLYLPGDYAFIDRGRDDGLAVGDELASRSGGDDQWMGRAAARFQVVGLRDEVATVRIVSIQAPDAMRPGLAMSLDRKMP